MNSKLIQAAALALGIFAGQAALAQVTVTETTTAPAVTTTTTTLHVSGPLTQSVPVTLAAEQKPFVVIDSKGCPTVLNSKVSINPIPYVTTVGCLQAITLFTPDDLITRRDDLLAKIAMMQCRGQLSAGAAGELIARVHAIDSLRPRPVQKDSTAYYKLVKRLYKDFDNVANDIRDMTDVPEKQIAGTYSYITF